VRGGGLIVSSFGMFIFGCVEFGCDAESLRNFGACVGFFLSACMRFRVQLFVCLWSVCWKRVLLEEFLVFGVRLRL
jgi:hypothetical protein